jgi:chaperone required for assembly of F1-ATPase
MRDDLSALFVADGERDPHKSAQRDLKRPLPKKFYKDVSVTPLGEGFGLALDGRPVRTPARAPLAVPNMILAEALAEEWRGQGERINPATMPKTRLVNTALDGVAREMDAVTAEIAKFAGSDFLCYRAAAPESLVEEQNAAWNPILDFFREKHSAPFVCAEGVMFVAQPEASVAAIRQAVAALADGKDGALKLAALHVMTTLTGSVLIALALAQGRLSFDEAWAAAHVDENYQLRLWGPDDEAQARREARMAEMRSAHEVFVALAE